MAAATEKDDKPAEKPSTKAAAADDKPKAPAEPQDVLVYLDSTGSLRAVWNIIKRQGFGGVSTGSHTIATGLSLVPAKVWPLVKDSATWKQHSEAQAEGKVAVRAIAGADGQLVAGWHAVKDKDAIAWVGKTGLLATLERLHTMESTRKPSRPEVAAAIDAQLRKVRELGASAR